jgi:hypothetical protein
MQPESREDFGRTPEFRSAKESAWFKDFEIIAKLRGVEILVSRGISGRFAAICGPYKREIWLHSFHKCYLYTTPMHSTLVDGVQRAILSLSPIPRRKANGSGSSRTADKRRWGVVQPVGHLTVNEDGEGSNPSAPANFLHLKYFALGVCQRGWFQSFCVGRPASSQPFQPPSIDSTLV